MTLDDPATCRQMEDTPAFAQNPPGGVFSSERESFSEACNEYLKKIGLALTANLNLKGAMKQGRIE
jgi:hypothetical protein